MIYNFEVRRLQALISLAKNVLGRNVLRKHRESEFVNSESNERMIQIAQSLQSPFSSDEVLVSIVDIIGRQSSRWADDR